MYQQRLEAEKFPEAEAINTQRLRAEAQLTPPACRPPRCQSTLQWAPVFRLLPSCPAGIFGSSLRNWQKRMCCSKPRELRSLPLTPSDQRATSPTCAGPALCITSPSPTAQQGSSNQSKPITHYLSLQCPVTRSRSLEPAIFPSKTSAWGPEPRTFHSKCPA